MGIKHITQENCCFIFLLKVKSLCDSQPEIPRSLPDDVLETQKVLSLQEQTTCSTEDEFSTLQLEMFQISHLSIT